MEKHKHSPSHKYYLCCGNEKVKLPFLQAPYEILSTLLFDHNSLISKKFQQRIRVYNMMFVFISLGAKFDNKYNNGYGPPTIWIQGQYYRQIGSLFPPEG